MHFASRLGSYTLQTARGLFVERARPCAYRCVMNTSTCCVLAIALGACGGGGNVGPDGAYSFSGDGWALDTTATSSGDHWLKGTEKLIVFTHAVQHTSAMDWATADYELLTSPPSSAPSLFAPTSLPGTSGDWFGWVFESQSENVYEYYFVGSSKELQAEIAGPGLSQTEAQTVLASLQLH